MAWCGVVCGVLLCGVVWCVGRGRGGGGRAVFLVQVTYVGVLWGTRYAQLLFLFSFVIFVCVVVFPRFLP